MMDHRETEDDVRACALWSEVRVGKNVAMMKRVNSGDGGHFVESSIQSRAGGWSNLIHNRQGRTSVK